MWVGERFVVGWDAFDRLASPAARSLISELALDPSQLLRALGRPAVVSGGAAVVMLIAPQNLDAASWFSASTDLFATVFVLAALVAVVRGNQVGATVAALAACLSKESASVLPLLALVVLHDRDTTSSPS